MSKLLDTLEKISKNEDVSRQPGGGRASSNEDTSRKTSARSVTVMAFIIIVLSVYGTWPYITKYINRFNAKNTKNAPHEVSVVNAPQKQKVKLVSHTTSEIRETRKTRETRETQKTVNKNITVFVRFNQLAVQYVHRNQPWKGIYYFQKAKAAVPSRIEPLINLAVVYAELGYYPKAVKLFEKAYSINPDFPPLRKNLKILYRANLLKGSLLAQKFKKKQPRNKRRSKL
ncbi:MAG TPA: tetratricopeptide repeat protein [Desulfobacterales bacterium]|nr:tetratricopeptide repeat protein [Desulfobacterales bacterium]